MTAREAEARRAAAAGRDAVAKLVAHIERGRNERCNEVLTKAAAEAEGIVAKARRRARLQVHEAAEEARGEAERMRRSARAKAETRLRQAEHKATAAALSDAWDRLRAALPERWAEAEARRTWVAAALDQAARALPPGTWTLTHPADWKPKEARDLLDEAARKREDVDIRTEATPDLQAGVRVSCGGACLDATPAGLLARPARVRALLLAALDAHHARPTAPPVSDAGDGDEDAALEREAEAEEDAEDESHDAAR